jgi:hypothetical protein
MCMRVCLCVCVCVCVRRCRRARAREGALEHTHAHSLTPLSRSRAGPATLSLAKGVRAQGTKGLVKTVDGGQLEEGGKTDKDDACDR